jgi:hypothetical protein
MRLISLHYGAFKITISSLQLRPKTIPISKKGENIKGMLRCFHRNPHNWIFSAFFFEWQPSGPTDENIAEMK